MARIPINDDNDQMNDPIDASEPTPNAEAPKAKAASREADTGFADYQVIKAERDSLFERLARATAEFKNSQRRLEQDLEARTAYANSSLIKSLLPVLDNFERAVSMDPAKTDTVSVLKGLQIVRDQLIAILKQQQVEEIAPTAGVPFDPSQHEALIQQDSEYKSPTVVQLLQKGYALKGRTLRPAQVAVSRTT